MNTQSFDSKFNNVVTLNEILFPVRVEDETLASNSEYSKRIVGEIGGQEFLLNQCSPRYELVPNAEIFPVVEQIFNAHGIRYEANYRMVNNARFYADYMLTDSNLTYKVQGTTDIIHPRLSVQHSYNGLTKYKIIFGYFRMICTNGLVIPVEEVKRHNLMIEGKHTINIQNSLKELNDTLEYFANNSHNVVTDIMKKYDILGGQVVKNLEDRIIEVLGFAKINVVENQNRNTLGFIRDVIEKESVAIGMHTNTDWLVYNGINQYIDNDNLNIAVPETRAALDSRVLEYLLAH